MSIEIQPIKQKNWFARHKVITIVGGIVLAIILYAIGSGGGGDKPSEAGSTPDATKPSAAAPVKEPEKPAEPVGIKGGQYKVGTDMPAGEYVIVGSGYLQISSDSTGSFESIIENDNYVNRSIITVADGQYVQFAGIAYTWEEAPKVDTSSGTLKEGMYKVGVDFPAGEYKVTPTGSGYYAVTTTATHTATNVVTNENFDTERYLTVQDGQYLKLMRCSLAIG